MRFSTVKNLWVARWSPGGERPLGRDRPGEQAALQGRIDDHADLVLAAEREDLGLDLPLDQAVRRLEARDRRRRPRPACSQATS